MAASRATSLRALSKLAKPSAQQTRGLRITPHNDASPFLSTQKPSFTKVREAIDDAAAAVNAAPTSTRQFNTSRSLKSVNDTSTIDFAFFPDLGIDPGQAIPLARVPLLPESLYPGAGKTKYAREEEQVVFTQEISTTSHVSTHHEPPAAFAGAANNAHEVMEEMKEQIIKEVGTVRHVVNGMLEDIFGVKGKK